MIISFGNKLAEHIFFEKSSKEIKKFPKELQRAAKRKLIYLNAAVSILDLKVPPGNKLEALRGDLKAYHSIRINNQWRVVFKWKGAHAEDVQILDYH